MTYCTHVQCTCSTHKTKIMTYIVHNMYMYDITLHTCTQKDTFSYSYKM